jgi:CheY-like chemotaxis protein
MNDKPSGLKRVLNDAVEVKFWEIYLLRNRNHLYSTVRKYSLDGGYVIAKAKDSEQVTFRFMKYDWDTTIMQLVTDQYVPFEIVRVFKTDVCRDIRKKKVYIAEDDLNILFSLDVMLGEAGYDVMLSHCGSRVMENDLPGTDLFILDNRMPDVNGIDLCRHLKNQPATRHVPVIMISAFHNFKSQAAKAGADEFLEKPFSMEELLNLVSKYTQTSGLLVSP